jgi:hypothetical protein
MMARHLSRSEGWQQGSSRMTCLIVVILTMIRDCVILAAGRMKMMSDTEKLLNFIRGHGKEYAQACADVEYLREFRKSKKALLEIEGAELNNIKTGQEREAYAYAHPDYIALLDGLKAAVEKEKYLGLMIKGCWVKVDLFRTQRADERAERKAYE